MGLPKSLQYPDNEIPEYTMVRVVNQGNTPYVMKWARAKYPIPPGGEVAVPWPCMVRHMGDPRTIDQPGNEPHKKERSHEFQRLCFFYGVYEHHDEFPAAIPQLAAYSLAGERIVSVLDDPYGEQDTQATISADAEIQRETTLNAMQSEIARMQSEIARLTGGEQGGSIGSLPALDDSVYGPPATGADPDHIAPDGIATDDSPAPASNEVTEDSPIRKISH